MRLSIAIVMASVAAWGGAASAAEPAQVEQGHQQFNRWCAPCHAAGLWEGRPLPGTLSLQLKYKGTPPAALEERTDLTAEAVGYFIRHGVGGMPFFRKTEISDREMAAIGAYLARGTRK